MTLDTEAITARLNALRRKHVVVDDCWYSCPLALQEDGTSECCQTDLMENPRCNCGADAHNAKLDAVGGDIAALLAEVARLKAEIEAEHLIREAAIAAQDSAMQLVAGLRAALQAVEETP